ncbi:unnamed protein product, partial [Mesorhabditis belari]|uniref:Uncharacterized protein n=1 Tax=Mesorhabditis belari TaxID=2138241 RepID=A0AAF3J6L5_9BILA
MPVLPSAPLPADVVVPLLELGDANDYTAKADVEIARPRVQTPVNHNLENWVSIVHQYARDGNLDGLRKMLQEHEVLLNLKDTDGLTALHYAARYRNYDVVKMLLDWNLDEKIEKVEIKPNIEKTSSSSSGPSTPFSTRGPRVDVNAESSEKFTPIHFAARYYRKDPLTDNYTPTGEDECSLVGVVTTDPTYKIIKLLHERGGKINAMDKYYLTPLHYAAMRGSACATQALLECRCAIDPVDMMNMSPLMTACVHGSSSVVQILINYGARVDLRDKRDNTVLHLAAQYGHRQVLDILLKAVQQYAHEDKEEVSCKKLLTDLVSPKYPAHVETFRFIDQTPLMLTVAAVAQLSTAATITTKHFGGETTRSMLRKPNIEGNTPLQLAVERNHIEVVEKMLELITKETGGVITGMTRDESLFPHIAASKGYLQILQALKMKGFSLEFENDLLEIPLHLAAENNHTDVVRFLLSEALGKPRRTTADDHPDLEVYADDIRVRTIEKCDKKGMTPLLRTAPSQAHSAAEVLLEYNANSFACDSEGRSAVFLAAKYNKTSFLEWFLAWVKRTDEDTRQERERERESSERRPGRGRMFMRRTLRTFAVQKPMVEQLVNRTNLDQDTPLHAAAVNGYLEACIVLKKYNANVDALNEDKQTALHLASITGHVPVVNILLNWSASLAKAKDDDGNSPLHEAAKNGKLR